MLVRIHEKETTLCCTFGCSCRWISKHGVRVRYPTCPVRHRHITQLLFQTGLPNRPTYSHGITVAAGVERRCRDEYPGRVFVKDTTGWFVDTVESHSPAVDPAAQTIAAIKSKGYAVLKAVHTLTIDTAHGIRQLPAHNLTVSG